MIAKKKRAPRRNFNAPPDELRTIEQVQAALGCKRSKIYSLARQGRLHLVKLDRATRITAGSLQHLLWEIANSPARVRAKKRRPVKLQTAGE